MPGWGVHDKYARRLFRELSLRYDSVMSYEINLLIDRPVDFIRSRLDYLLKVVREKDPELCRLLYLQFVLGIPVLGGVFKHDWGCCRLKKSAAFEILLRLAEILYGREGILLAQLHASLDSISKWGFDLGRYLEWAEIQGILEEVRDYVCRYWNEIRIESLSARRRRSR